MTTFNWAQYLLGQGKECIFTPRASYAGREALPEVLQHAGEKVTLTALWQMSDEDPYPGEWTLSAVNMGDLIFGRAWVASGDVTPVEDSIND